MYTNGAEKGQQIKPGRTSLGGMPGMLRGKLVPHNSGALKNSQWLFAKLGKHQPSWRLDLQHLSASFSISLQVPDLKGLPAAKAFRSGLAPLHGAGGLPGLGTGG